MVRRTISCQSVMFMEIGISMEMQDFHMNEGDDAKLVPSRQPRLF